MKPALKRPGCVPRVGFRAERRLAEAHVDGVVEPLHPDRHLGSAPGARPAVGHAMERLPETPPEADLDSQRYRPLAECGTRCDGTNGFAGIRRALPLPQRGRYPIILDKETDVRFRSSRKRITHGYGNPAQVGLDNNCFCDRRDSRGVKKRKERPPKDSRPKEKRFRHGGRKGRRSPRERNRSR